jgi:hypothetical protein
MPVRRESPITPCRIEPEVRRSINAFAEALKAAAPGIGEHGLPEAEFWRAGLFRGAIEKLRGTQSATTAEKQAFVGDVLSRLEEQGMISSWRSAATAERHDYEVIMPNGRVCAIEAKGCLDGNNTNIYQRPPNADEFVIWSLCQNPGADPRHNAWSGIHTRLGAEIIHKGELVDALIIWDDLCGTLGRPCPKLVDPTRATIIGDRSVPPPCIYLFPRTVPDPRNNPRPPAHELANLAFVRTLYDALRCDEGDVTSVLIEASMKDNSVARRTTLSRRGAEIQTSAVTKIRRAR